MVAFFVVFGCALGLTLGYVLPLRWFGYMAGFKVGVICGLFVTILAGMLTASLLGGWCEVLIGTTVGVPIGVTAGTFLGSAIMNCVVGFLGIAGVRGFHVLVRCFHGG